VEFSFVETTVFTRRIGRLGLEDGLRELQRELLENPEAGALDPGTGGLRKVRMAVPHSGKGKRGGARVHYLLLPHKKLIYLLFVYGKDEVATLGEEQKRQLRAVVEAIKREHS
jgi:hypothetical protein